MIDFPPHIAERMRHGEIEICQIQFINIELVRRQSGERWGALKAKVFDIGAFFIEKRLHKDDIILRCKDGFIVIFADALPPPPALRAEALSLEMNEFFVGEEAFRALSIKCNHLKFQPGELAVFLAGQNATLDESVRMPRAASDDSGEPAAPPIGSKKPDLVESDPLSDAEIVFEPVWDPRLETATTNMVLARGPHPQTGHKLRGRQLCFGDNRRRHNARYDCLVLNRTIKEIQSMREARQPAAFSVPIHIQTICRRESRMEYFNLIRALSEPLRRYLFFYIDGILAGTPISQIEDAFRSLRPFGAGAMAMLEFGHTDLSPFNNVEMRLVGWPCPAHEPVSGLSPVQIKDIRHFTGIAKQKKRRTFMAQVSSPRALDQCVEAGIDFIAGTIIGASQTYASPPYALRRSEMANVTDDIFEV
jgi:hypothetical protein